MQKGVYTFDVHPDVEDDDDDEDYYKFDKTKLKRIDPSHLDKVFGKKDSDEGGGGGNRINPTIVIKEINDEYRQNKKAKILSAINPEDKPEEVEEWDTRDGDSKIVRMIVRKEEEQRREKYEWQNEKMAFVKHVVTRLGLKVAPTYSSSFNYADYHNEKMAIPQKGSLQDINLPKKRNDLDTGQPIFQVESVTKEDRRDYKFSKDVKTVVNDSDVEGIIEIPPEIITGISSASTYLLSVDHAKFMDKNKWEHFLKDQNVSTMFGDLVSALISIDQMQNPKVYTPVRTLDDRMRWRSMSASTMRDKLTWVSKHKGDGHWKIANPAELEKNRRDNAAADAKSIREASRNYR